MNSLKIIDTVDDEQGSTETKTENYVVNYLKSMLAIEEAIEPYKEQKRELKKEYLEKKWLSKEDISLSVRAQRLLKDNVDSVLNSPTYLFSIECDII